MEELTANAIKLLKEIYLLKDDSGTVIETPKGMFSRVSKFVAKDNHDEKEFFDVMSNLEFLPNSPTLMNAGKNRPQLNSCFALPIEDNIDSIFRTLWKMATLNKSGGEACFSFSKLRPKNDIIKTSKGLASGPVSFMSIFERATEVIKQGCKRRSANIGILNVHHPDIIDFIKANVNSNLSNFNLSVAITDDFIRALKYNGRIALRNPRTNKIKSLVKASEILDLIVDCAWKNGCPGIIYIDEINKKKHS